MDCGGGCDGAHHAVVVPAYARVAVAMTFTLPMMLARLTIGALEPS
jgi:hypothetical protein